MAQYRRPATVKATSRQKGAVNTEVHGHESVHETPQQAAAQHIEREDAANTWVRSTNLDAPQERPGMRQKWVRWRFGNNVDHKNLSRKRRESWNYRPLETVPEEFRPETANETGLGNVFSVDDMVLMELPEAKARARERHFAGRTERQSQAVDESLLRVENQGGTPINRYSKSKVSLGSRRGRVVDPD